MTYTARYTSIDLAISSGKSPQLITKQEDLSQHQSEKMHGNNQCQEPQGQLCKRWLTILVRMMRNKKKPNPIEEDNRRFKQPLNPIPSLIR
ncbi:hypothetical protein JTB14_033321 [Gonioctena quinquepunctata]|nr:hypothetical protein JTB14_033321 [Gonioctena quinquepunctata]